jgi:uncharacterized protein
MLQPCQKALQVFVYVTVLIACGSPPQVHFYVLEAESLPAAVVKTDSAKKSVIGIGPVSIPALLERKQIVSRADQNAVQIAEFDQWAAPLQDNVTQVITQNLAVLQNHYVIRSYPWSAHGPVNYRVIIDIDRFDTRPGHSVNLVARWSIMDENTHAIVSNNQSSIEHPLADPSYSATVKALSEALFDFSRELVQELDQLK